MSYQKRAAYAKALENIGGMIGNYMTQSALAEERDQRDIAREERADQRLMEREQRADERKFAEEQRKRDDEEAKLSKIGKQTQDAYEGAESVSAERRAKGLLASADGLSKDAIAKPNGERYERWADGKTEDEIKQKALEQVRNLPPEARRIYEEQGMLPKESDPRLQRYLDASESAAKSGASRETLEHFEKAKAKVLEEIKAENTVKAAEIRADSAMKVAEKNMEKSLAVVNRQGGGGSGGGGDGKDDSLKRLKALYDMAQKEKPELLTPTTNTAKAEHQRALTEWQERYGADVSAYESALRGGSGAPKPAVTTETRPAPVASAFKTGASKVIQSGPNKGKTAVFDGTGWLLKN